MNVLREQNIWVFETIVWPKKCIVNCWYKFETTILEQYSFVGGGWTCEDWGLAISAYPRLRDIDVCRASFAKSMLCFP
jgi:hypothetical protein